MTKFLPDHPGGGESITINAGTDSTDEFNTLHGENARNMLEDYYIGELVTEDTQKAPQAAVRNVLPSFLPFLCCSLLTLLLSRSHQPSSLPSVLRCPLLCCQHASSADDTGEEKDGIK